jgi:S-adenosylmethionine:tRNA ribosyltransferase-isomerase
MLSRDFDFPLPKHLVAQEPLERRDASRLMVLLPGKPPEHRRFREIGLFLRQGDALVLNNTKVLPARLLGRKPTGGKVEVLLLGPLQDERHWRVLLRRPYQGRLEVSPELSIHVHPGGVAELLPPKGVSVREVLWRVGRMPLPPYIRRQPGAQDRERYQTVYARKEGSVAAPTAGLHFTEELLQTLKARGVRLFELTLHVGEATFRPIRTEEITRHRMAQECFELPKGLLQELQALRRRGGRVFAVGTTTTRALEAAASGDYTSLGQGANGTLRASTGLFIYPGFAFQVVDCLITNFHLPRSSPLLLTAALAGTQRLLQAYQEAIRQGYRFFSYGDAMLIVSRE